MAEIRVYQYIVEAAIPNVPPTDKVRVHQVALEAAVPASHFTGVSGTIGGNSILGYVRSYQRQAQLCQPGQVVTLILSTSYPYSVTPGQSVVLNEHGIKVLTGYVISTSRSRPSYDWSVEIMDTYTRAINTFIEEEEQTTPGQDTHNWLADMASRAGLLVNIYSEPRPVPPGVQIGLRSVSETINDILAYASSYATVDPEGTLIVRRKGTSLGGGIAPTYYYRKPIAIEDTRSDEQTRNVVKVFGGNNNLSPYPNTIFASGRRGISGLLVDMTAVVGNPLIETQDEAARVVTYMLDELASITRQVTFIVPGDPIVRIGDNASLRHDAEGHDYSVTGLVTSLSTRLDEKGYITNVTVGERCPRISGFSETVPPIALGTRGYGAFISYTKGQGWSDFNAGLPQGPKNVKRIAINAFGQCMAIVNEKLWYNGGGGWAEETLPSPINSAGDSPAPGVTGNLVTVDATGGDGGFAVLMTGVFSGGKRSWVYERTSGSRGGPTSGSWNSTALVYDDPTSGSTYSAIGYDLSSRYGTINVLASSGSDQGDYDSFWDPDCIGGFAIYRATVPPLTLSVLPADTYNPEYTSETTLNSITLNNDYPGGPVIVTNSSVLIALKVNFTTRVEQKPADSCAGYASGYAWAQAYCRAIGPNKPDFNPINPDIFFYTNNFSTWLSAPVDSDGNYTFDATLTVGAYSVGGDESPPIDYRGVGAGFHVDCLIYMGGTKRRQISGAPCYGLEEHYGYTDWSAFTIDGSFCTEV